MLVQHNVCGDHCIDGSQNLKGQQYSWVSSVSYFGYILWEYPTTILIARLPTAKYLTVNTLFWDIVVSMTAACTNFGGLMRVRFLLGVVEATMKPGFKFTTSTCYTRDEVPSCVGIWFAGKFFGGLLSSLFVFGVGHIDVGDGHTSSLASSPSSGSYRCTSSCLTRSRRLGS